MNNLVCGFYHSNILHIDVKFIKSWFDLSIDIEFGWPTSIALDLIERIFQPQSNWWMLYFIFLLIFPPKWEYYALNFVSHMSRKNHTQISNYLPTHRITYTYLFSLFQTIFKSIPITHTTDVGKYTIDLV